MSPKGGEGGSTTKKTTRNTYGTGAKSGDCTSKATIRFSSAGINPHSCSVEKGACVAWRDQTGTARSLRFQSWPFTETWTEISVPAGGTSATYHVAQLTNKTDVAFDYWPNPPMPSGPPDPPDVTIKGT